MNRFPVSAAPAPNEPGAGVADFLRVLARSALGLDDGTLSHTNSQALGGNIVVRAAPVTGPPIAPNDTSVSPTWMSLGTIARSDAKRKASPKVITVTMNPPVVALAPSTNEVGAGYVVDVKARIQWGAGADTVTADVDCNAGTQVTVLGSFVQVAGIYTVYDPNSVAGSALPVGVPNEVMLGAAFSYGSRAVPAIGTSWTTYASLAAAGDDDTVQSFVIPPFANSLSVNAIDPLTDLSVPIGVQFAGQGVNLGAFAQLANALSIYPIPGGAQSVVISNPGVACQVTLRFGLNL